MIKRWIKVGKVGFVLAALAAAAVALVEPSQSLTAALLVFLLVFGLGDLWLDQKEADHVSDQ